MSRGRISALFAIWSAASIVLEVPAGVLADRFSRRYSIVAAGVIQAAGYALWVVRPGFAGYAAGFVLWGVSGALVSGALQALVFDALSAAGARDHYAKVMGRVTASGMLAQLPAAAAAAVLYRLGGYPVVVWFSVGLCLSGSALATRLPEVRHRIADDADDKPDDQPNSLSTFKAALAVANARSGVRLLIVAVAVLTGIDALDEYFPLMADDWGVPTSLNPLATMGIPLIGAVGAALAGSIAKFSRPYVLAFMLAVAGLLLGGAGLLRQPIGLVAVAVFYGLYQLTVVVIDARLQERIEASSRATVSSIAGMGTEVCVFGIYAAWAIGGVRLIAVLTIVLALALPRMLGRRGSRWLRSAVNRRAITRRAIGRGKSR
jgi:MFS family permease